MVARLFGPGLFSFVAACGFGTAAATGICFSCSMNHSARRLGGDFVCHTANMGSSTFDESALSAHEDAMRQLEQREVNP